MKVRDTFVGFRIASMIPVFHIGYVVAMLTIPI